VSVLYINPPLHLFSSTRASDIIRLIRPYHRLFVTLCTTHRPQNTPEDIAKLCETTDISHLIYHESMQKAAQKAEAFSDSALLAVPLLVFDERLQQHRAISLDECVRARSPLTPEQESETECIIFHSSGSSGTPKVSPSNHSVRS
jgi:acyl-coenzyme A synthetase/AMP-(fatty) acid ligase